MATDKFILQSNFKPTGDQPQAIEKLVRNIKKGKRFQVLLGVTGSGKTFTLANAISKVNLPTLVISHNKTLAAQLYSEFKSFFPENAVEYFVSYYDYYQPEAYIPETDTYIEKDASINDRLDRLRLSATSSLMSRRDVIVVASVSCIYNLGSPQEYEELMLYVSCGQYVNRRDFLKRLVTLQYERNDYDFKRGTFRVRGGHVDIFPSYREDALRVEFDSGYVKNIMVIDPLAGEVRGKLDKVGIFPAKHFIVSQDRVRKALLTIQWELEDRLRELKAQGKIIEAQRLLQRTKYDMEMLEQTGYCHGIENYSRHLSGREPGSRPYCLLDYFPQDFLVVIDESHVTVPQLRGMYYADHSRKLVLVEHGFRLPSCLDNRPLKFEELMELLPQVIFVSATPDEYEINLSVGEVVEQLIRPTGIPDPQIIVKPTQGQVQDLIEEIRKRLKYRERVLVTTLTKRTAEDLASFLQEEGIKTRYLHSEIDTIERAKILSDLRKKNFDVLVGINLLREGLDLPEVSLVAILDADREGFLRSFTSLIQTAGRAARNINGTVIMYADNITDSMMRVIKETNRRRKVQLDYNREHNIEPKTVQKAIREGIELYQQAQDLVLDFSGLDRKTFEVEELLKELTLEMEKAARNLQFEKAAWLRDRIFQLKEFLKNKKDAKHTL